MSHVYVLCKNYKGMIPQIEDLMISYAWMADKARIANCQTVSFHNSSSEEAYHSGTIADAFACGMRTAIVFAPTKTRYDAPLGWSGRNPIRYSE